MNTFTKALSALTLAAVFSTGAAVAQDHDDHRDPHAYVKHDEWHKGATIRKEDWSRGAQVDWHAHHLQSPPRGYEWREVDGNYVLAAAATGIIAATVLASTH